MSIIIRVNLSLWKGKDMKEREEENLTLLGNQGVKYPTDYNPEVLETFENKHPGNDYFVKFNCPIFRMSGWWRVSLLSCIFSASVIMETFMRTA